MSFKPPVGTTASTDFVDDITDIASDHRTGSDDKVVTGTEGTSGNLAQWNADGDLVDASVATSDVVTPSSTDTLTNKTIDQASNTLTLTAGSTTTAGVLEVATAAETTTGTDATRAVSPDGLAGSTIFGVKSVQMVVFDFATTCATGDGKFYFHVPSSLNGMNLVGVHAECITAGTTGTMDIQIHNLTQTADMLSTVITIDSGETGSDEAATPAVIDTDEDDVATNDLLRIDVDAVHTTPAEGLIVTLDFQLP